MTDQKNKVSSFQPWIVCLTAALFFFYEFVQMGMFNSISPELMKDFDISATQLGYLSATYFYADVIFLFFAGILLDRLSTRKVIMTAMSVCIGATIVFGLSKSVIVAGMSHFVSGIGNAFCLLSCIKLISRWFPPKKTALVVGLVVTIAMAGGMFAQTPMTLLVQALGWRHAIFVDAFLGVVCLTVIAWNVVDFPPRWNESLSSHHQASINLKQDIIFVFKNSQNWLGGLYTSLLNLPIFLLGELWGVMYLTQVHHIDRAHASYITAMVFVGTIIGSPIVGAWSDRMGKRRFPMIVGAVLSLLVMLIIMYVPGLHFISLLLLFLGLGIFTSAQIISYPAIVESNPKNITTTATGLAAVLIMGGGAVFQPLFGWLMDLHGTGHMVNGIEIYSKSDFMRGMMIMPIAFVIGLICSLRFKETHCQPYHLDAS